MGAFLLTAPAPPATYSQDGPEPALWEASLTPSWPRQAVNKALHVVGFSHGRYSQHSGAGWLPPKEVGSALDSGCGCVQGGAPEPPWVLEVAGWPGLTPQDVGTHSVWAGR